jgi:adenosylhomocysteine nucleosidase
MAAEARVARTAGFSAIVGAGNAISTAILIGNTRRHTKCLISFGVAGGLAPYLRPGDVILSTEVIGNDRRWLAEAMFRCAVATLAQQLGLFEGPTLGSHDIIASKEEKRHAWRETGALAVDLESAIVATAAEAARIPFLVLRAIADPATRELPPAALIPFCREKNTVLLRLITELLRQPRQIAALLMLAFEAQCALAALAAPARALHQALATINWDS